MAETGTHNALTDVEGILVGNYTDTEAVSGVTVVVCPRGAVAGVDVRGSGPCTRETDLLSPQNPSSDVTGLFLVNREEDRAIQS